MIMGGLDLNNKMLFMAEPMLNTSSVYASVLSIISDDLKKIQPWIMTHFIQLRYVEDWDVLFFDNHHVLFATCPWIESHGLSREFMSVKWRTFKDFIIDAISHDYYIWCHVDRYYLPPSSAYHNRHHDHELLIFGYDVDQNKVHFADYLSDGKFAKFTHTECGLDEMEEAFWSMNSDNPHLTSINLLRKREYRYSINLDYVIESIQRYLFSKPTYTMHLYKTIDVYGLDIYYKIITKNERIGNHPEFEMDVRIYHLLWEHKKLMKDRILYFMENGLVHQSSLADACDELVNNVLIIRNMSMKYNVSKDIKLLQRINSKIASLALQETEMLKTLLSNLV
ncbi:hypothetical protein DFQ01_107107 [Paenibacillus cellulosilyticus]|uniref:Butirosin biosynthesis protein H-like n=2 Tax=Paenibacillus cellulosilyticus TaxID=375489 RepID=A0A2V2YUT3_9BACL|nr:hypothetical protein DFQ01_107107 [Paenibacillus cellulosilyticus]